jgi:hypothetical protein
MITTETPDKQTGGFSRIQQPFAPLAPANVAARVQRGSIQPPIRNMLAGWMPTSIFGRVKAWLRGEL